MNIALFTRTMDDDEASDELLTALKEPLVKKPKRVSKRKNHIRGVQKQKRYICVGIILMLAVIALVVLFLGNADINDMINFRTQKKIMLVNWYEDVHWETPDCQIRNWDGYDTAHLLNSDAVVVNWSKPHYAEQVFHPQYYDKPYFIFGMQDPPLLGEYNVGESVLGAYDAVLSYSHKSDIMWRKYQLADDKGTPLPAGLQFSAPPNFTSWNNSISTYRRQYNYSFPVAMTVLNAPCQGKRHDLVVSLQKHMEVHVYGDCSSGGSCPDNSCETLPKYFEGKNYKFYLAFEEYNCTDYISDDFYKALGHLVPVVLGGANYELFAIRGAYIDASEFPSMELLAKHLIYLDAHPEDYASYVMRMERYRVIKNQQPFDKICSFLLNPTNKTQFLYRKWLSYNKCYPYSKLTQLL